MSKNDSTKKLHKRLRELKAQCAELEEKLAADFEFRTELYEDVMLTKDALGLVRQVIQQKRSGDVTEKSPIVAIRFDADDGPEALQTVDSLRQLAPVVAWRLLRCGSYSVEQLTDESSASSGAYILLAE